jgi:hypothetical protein
LGWIVRQLLHSRPDVAGHSFRYGQDLRQDRVLHLVAGQTVAGQTVAGQTGELASRYGCSGQSERELQAYPEAGPQPAIAWPPRDVCLRPEAILLGDDLLDDPAAGHWKAVPELHSLPGPLPAHPSARRWSRPEVSVVPGKVNDRLARFAGDGMRMLILRPVVHWVAHPVVHLVWDWIAPRERTVPVFRLPWRQPRVCLVACPGEPGHACLAAAQCGELLLPCLVPQWVEARRCVPVGERAACP